MEEHLDFCIELTEFFLGDSEEEEDLVLSEPEKYPTESQNINFLKDQSEHLSFPNREREIRNFEYNQDHGDMSMILRSNSREIVSGQKRTFFDSGSMIPNPIHSVKIFMRFF